MKRRLAVALAILALASCAAPRSGDMGQSNGASLANWLKAHP